MRKKEAERLNGVVKWFDVRKGFGFLSDEDGLDYFIHFSEIQGEGFKKLRNGQKVTFEAGEDSRGRSVAQNIAPEPERVDSLETGEEGSISDAAGGEDALTAEREDEV